MSHKKLIPLFVLFLWCVVSKGLIGAESEWMAKYVAPLEGEGTLITITKVKASRSKHDDREFVIADFDSTPEARRINNRDIRLVILPIGGGRHDIPSTDDTVTPLREKDHTGGFTVSLLDFRGNVPRGARAYIEIPRLTVDNKVASARLSNVFWFGTPEQLLAAQKNDPPDPSKTDLRSVAMKTLPEEAVVPAGMPVRFSRDFSSHWNFGTVMEKSPAGKPVRLVIYLQQAGSHFQLPWHIDANRSDIKVEPAALIAGESENAVFRDRVTETTVRIDRMMKRKGEGAVPDLLKPIGTNVSKGQRALWISKGGLKSGNVKSAASDGKVTMVDSRFKQEWSVEVDQLYIDPDQPTTK